MILRTLIIALLFSIYSASFASESQSPVIARLGKIVVEIPTEFGVANRTFPNKQSILDVYVSRKDLPPTLIQLNRIVVPEAQVSANEKDRYDGIPDLLLGFLRTFSKNVVGWSRSSIEPIRLGGYIAAKSKWSGSYHGVPTTGVMYLVVIGKESFFLHAFGRDDVPNKPLTSAIKAIEHMSVDLLSTRLD